MTSEKLELLKEKLKNIGKSYDNFVSSMLVTSKTHKGFADSLLKFLNDNPTADADDVSQFEMEYIGIPYFDESDGKWHRWDEIISEEEAKAIVQKEYCDD
ncbi:MAG: hypothetical protein ACI4RN_02625 [Oscillospiraceae bacterium]